MKQDTDSNLQDTESRILEAAEKEFLEKGFAGARTTSIAEAAGVTHAMLHYYFRTKEKLFDKIITEKVKLMRELVLGPVEKSDAPLFEKIESIISRHLDFVAQNPSLPRFILFELAEQPERMEVAIKELREAAANVFSSLQAQIDVAVEKGECNPVRAEMLMLDIISLNIFPLLAAPMVRNILNINTGEINRFLEMRKTENINTIMRKLKP